MGRVVDRSVRARYRSDWRGILAYVFTPEAWTTPMFTVFVMAIGAFIFVVMADVAAFPYVLIQVPVKMALGYWFVLRPVVRVAERRASSQRNTEVR